MTKILISTHNFCILNPTGTFKAAMLRYIYGLTHNSVTRNNRGQVIANNSKVFATATASRSEYRLHINCLDEFTKFLDANGVDIKQIEYETVPLKDPVVVLYDVNKEIVPRDYQIPVVEYLSDDKNKNHKLLPLPTGQGKTICSLLAVGNLGYRTCFIMKPSYIHRWVPDIINVLNIGYDDVVTVNGAAQLKSLISQTMSDDLDYKAVLISNKTYQSYIKEYEKFGDNLKDFGYDCMPYEFFNALGIGIRVIDEVHQDYHFNFKLDLYTNVTYSMSLSATLFNNDEFIENMYRLAYPPAIRYKGAKYTKFVHAKTIFYTIDKNVNIKISHRGTSNYSHNAYEDSILHDRVLLSNYLKLIDDAVYDNYITKREPGDKCAVFASSIKMCTVIAEYLSEQYSDLTVKRYVSEDPYSNLIEPDIRVTTISSGGTAHDIAGLTSVVMTVSIDSIQANVQSFGRLRPKDGKIMRITYLVNEGISKHLIYHRNRKKMLQQRALNNTEVQYHEVLRGRVIKHRR